jgi:hypothetical protein
MATDFFFRPVNLASFQSWQPDLDFELINPSSKPVWLKISVRRTGVMLALETDKPIALNVFPANVLMTPETRRRVSLSYDNIGSQLDPESYEVIVEQLPIWFAQPGEYNLPETMDVRRYITEVKVRPGKPQQQIFASSLIAKDQRRPARHQKLPAIGSFNNLR